MHFSFSNMPKVFLKTAFIQGAELFQHDHGIVRKAAVKGGQQHMGGQIFALDLSGNNSCNDRGTVPVPNIVLDYQNRPVPSLL